MEQDVNCIDGGVINRNITQNVVHPDPNGLETEEQEVIDLTNEIAPENRNDEMLETPMNDADIIFVSANSKSK